MTGANWDALLGRYGDIFQYAYFLATLPSGSLSILSCDQSVLLQPLPSFRPPTWTGSRRASSSAMDRMPTFRQTCTAPRCPKYP
jgi:hypothetical protein